LRSFVECKVSHFILLLDRWMNFRDQAYPWIYSKESLIFVVLKNTQQFFLFY
jgi:hypothetical protein